jgi:hypothetical protein
MNETDNHGNCADGGSFGDVRPAAGASPLLKHVRPLPRDVSSSFVPGIHPLPRRPEPTVHPPDDIQRTSVEGLGPDSTSDCHSSAETNEDCPYRITARNVRGLQIGERNLQVNTYEYEVERPNIDFEAVLSRAHVREALKALSYDPDNADLQRKTDRLLAQGPLFRKKPELHVEQSTMSSERQWSLFEAFIFVRKCEGVQVGNDATQKNRFVYVVAPTVHARQLLADDPSVRAAFIRCVCSTNVARSEDTFRDELAGALGDAILSSPGIRTTGTKIRHPYGRVDIADEDGAQVDLGRKGRQENKASAVVVIPRGVVNPVREEREILKRLGEQDEEAFPREPHEQDNGSPGVTYISDRFGIGASLENGGISDPSETRDYGGRDDPYGGLDDR